MSKLSPTRAVALEEAVRALDAALLAAEAEPGPLPVSAPRKRTTPTYVSRPVAWHRLLLAAEQVTALTGNKCNHMWRCVYADDYQAAWSALNKVITDHHLKIDLAQQQRKAATQ